MNELVFPKTKNKKVIPTYVYVECPECKKPRLLKQQHADGTVDEVSDETYQAVDDTTRPFDVCGFCRSKNDRRDRQYMKRQILQLQRAAEQAEQNGGDVDIEL